VNRARIQRPARVAVRTRKILDLHGAKGGLALSAAIYCGRGKVGLGNSMDRVGKARLRWERVINLAYGGRRLTGIVGKSVQQTLLKNGSGGGRRANKLVQLRRVSLPLGRARECEYPKHGDPKGCRAL